MQLEIKSNFNDGLKIGLIHDKRYLHLIDIRDLQLEHITICQQLNNIQNNSCLALWKRSSFHIARVFILSTGAQKQGGTMIP